MASKEDSVEASPGGEETVYQRWLRSGKGGRVLTGQGVRGRLNALKSGRKDRRSGMGGNSRMEQW